MDALNLAKPRGVLGGESVNSPLTSVKGPLNATLQAPFCR